MITRADVVAARARVAPYLHRTPVMTSRLLDEIAGCELLFKCEHLQKAGAFKSRGAVNAVFSLDEREAQRGVATHSSGNHGAALARAARLRGIPASIVVPENASAAKKAAILAYGAEVILCEPTLAARESTLAAVVSERGANVVHPYDDDRVIAGQGTAAMELVEQAPGLDAIVTPVGGGGLLAGTVIATESGVRVYGAEPAGADDAHRSLATGVRVESQVPNTICDGLLTTLGARNFDIIRPRVRAILLASDDAVIDAMRLIYTRLKQVVEPSAAVTLAAVLANPDTFAGRRVGLVLTGGNVDLSRLPF